MKLSEPRKHAPGLGWPVDLARDRQSNCKSCDAPIYWVKIQTRAGAVRTMPLSEATAQRDASGAVYMASHFSDCPNAEQHRT